MLMWLRMAPALHLIFLLIIHRVSAAGWGVNYSPSQICALQNSSVTISCTFTYPTTGYQIMKVFWNKDLVKNGGEFADLSEDPEYSQRLQYLGDKQQNCTIRLSHVTKNDEHQYYFRITTNVTYGKLLGIPGVRLNVTDLQLESPERVTEGDSVRLTCKRSCNLTDKPTFIWYRNSERLTTGTTGDKLILDPVRGEDAGRYSCAVLGNTLASPYVYLNVTYPPKNVSVSINGSAVIVKGDSVSLICSSNSNPPALNFSWFKGDTSVGSGRVFSISKISSDDSGEYKCRARNDLGEKYSAPVTLDVQYPPRNVSISIRRSAVIMSGDSVTLNCSSDSNPPALFSWFKGTTYVGSGRIFNILNISSDDSGEYKCKAKNEHGVKYSDPVTLDVQYPPRNISVSISGPAVIMSGDSVTLSCSSDSNPPALNFSWFKGDTSVGSGRIFSISKISSDDSGEYKCRAKNDHGEKYSDPVTLDVQYAPRNISVSISGSAVIMSGDSVTLNCSSDSNPPAEINWFKGETSVGSGRIFNISKISSGYSGEYKCRARNKHGEEYSDPVTLDVQYPPRNVSVSISGSAVIMSGDSVTLSCSSDSNPPAEISWFKGETSVGSGRFFNISKISSDDSGEYKCRARNAHGEKYSDPVTLDVQYPPRNISVSVSGSHVVMSGDSVSLNCSSDSNPPAEISWFKEESFVGSGRIFNIPKISSDDSGEYKCRARNEHGEKYSDPVTLDVQYPPRNVSMSISGSAVIMSGDSVTLNCSSDSNPPAEINWFKATKYVGSGRIFNISKISSDDSGEYKCRARNEHGEKNSDPVTLDVQYPPRNISVSLSGPSVIMFGDSVTLSCSSDSNPPAQISWFKGETPVGSGRIFSISNISSDDSGEYKCRVKNEHREKYSDPVTLDVQYPPKNVSVSVIESGQLWSDSVSLMCISDSNPPALSFSWFKENQSSAVGSGQSFSAVQSGRFYCEAHNPHGAQRSDAVTVTVQQGAGRTMTVIIVTSAGLIIILILLAMLFKWKCKRSALKESAISDSYGSMDPQPTTSDLYDTPTEEAAVRGGARNHQS